MQKGTNLANADLTGADLNQAELVQANLRGADLSEARDLTQKQVDSAYGDEKTKLPKGIVRPKPWTKTSTK